MTNPTDNTIARIEAIERAQKWLVNIRSGGPFGDAPWIERVRDIETLLSTAQQTEELRERIVALWHDGNAYHEAPLHECLGMTWEEYAEWANPDAHTVEIKPDA